MVTKINYNQIQNMLPEEAASYLQQTKKGFVREATVLDLLNAETLNRPFAETYFVDLHTRGVYLFFDSNDVIRYIGQTNQGFYNRLMTQLDTTFYKGFGWNALFRILGGKRTGKAHDELTEEDHEVEYNEVINYKLLLVSVGTQKEMPNTQLKKLERVLLKTFREQEGSNLVNSGMGWLLDVEWNKTINKLINVKTK